MMNLINRLKAPTPAFFKNIRNAGLALAAAGTALLTAPVALPAAIIKLAGYLTVAGTVASAISQATTKADNPAPEHESAG